VDGQPFEAIRDFDLAIEQGEFIAIVGSGCGKSTLLRLLVGLDNDYSGQIRVDGQAVSGIGGERGIVFQEHRLFPWLTVAQNIGLGLVNEPLTQGERARRVHEFVQLVGLVGFDRPTRTSSPVAWPSAWRSPGGWWPARASCCSTSRSAPWMR
jgi:sulfonate transport system ATP-binding protein